MNGDDYGCVSGGSIYYTLGWQVTSGHGSDVTRQMYDYIYIVFT